MTTITLAILALFNLLCYGAGRRVGYKKGYQRGFDAALKESRPENWWWFEADKQVQDERERMWRNQ